MPQHLVETLYLVPTPYSTTISCHPLRLAPLAFDARILHNTRPYTAQRTAPSTAYNPHTPARFALSRRFMSTHINTLADPKKPRLENFGRSRIQTRTSTTRSRTSHPSLAFVQVAQHNILWYNCLLTTTSCTLRDTARFAVSRAFCTLLHKHTRSSSSVRERILTGACCGACKCSESGGFPALRWIFVHTAQNNRIKLVSVLCKIFYFCGFLFFTTTSCVETLFLRYFQV